ncbi:DUF2232 domain-containing protein [Clostridium cylindrosporum]|uniref:Putative membrane protein n=1 Tax=Clostridium cylindrosporum DSM 605 TaxID=1121307 RepID=A0A0J8D7A8_CLOCY|nr:DUF2232 domain-containing protein [Clostridium cylindrosporum]KMT21782.1 putative membrane protein [Clostridium cylindrosporum DSM 605]
MESQSSTKALVGTALFSAITVVLYVISTYIPIIDILVILGVHLPIVVIYLKYGGKYAGVSTAVTTILLTFILGPTWSLRFLFLNAVVGLVLGYTSTKKFNSITSIAMLSLITLLSVGVFYKLFTFMTGVDLMASSVDTVIKSMEASLATLKESGVDKTLTAGINLDDLKTYLLMAMPGISIVTMGVLSYIYYLVTQKILKRFGFVIEPVKEFSNWYLQSRIAYPLMILLFGVMIFESKELSIVGYTIRIIFLMAFTINALSTISYYLKKFSFPNPLIGIIVFVVLMTLQNVLIFIGLIEYALNLRALDNKRASIRRKK